MLAYLTLIYTLNTLLSIHMPSSGYDLVLLPGKKNSWGINFTRCWKCSLGILVHAEFIPYAVPVWCYCWIRFHFANLLFHHLGSVQTTDVTVMFLESSEMTRWALISLLLSLLPDCFLRASFPFFFLFWQNCQRLQDFCLSLYNKVYTLCCENHLVWKQHLCLDHAVTALVEQ